MKWMNIEATPGDDIDADFGEQPGKVSRCGAQTLLVGSTMQAATQLDEFSISSASNSNSFGTLTRLRRNALLSTTSWQITTVCGFDSEVTVEAVLAKEFESQVPYSRWTPVSLELGRCR